MTDLLYIAIAAIIAFNVFFFVRDQVLKRKGYNMLSDGKFAVRLGEGMLGAVDLFIAFPTDGEYLIPIAIAIVVLFAVVFTLMGKKQLGMPLALILGVFQSVCCLFVGLIFMFASNKANSIPVTQEETPMDPIMAADLQKADFTARQNGYTDANHWAVSNGYSDAEEAYKSGFFNGK